MKRPSAIQLFFARQYPMKLWLGASTLGMTVLAIAATEPTRATFLDSRRMLLFGVVTMMSPVLGFFLGVVAGSVILPPIYALMERLNGGPFKAGDLVQILAGPHRGTITTVASAWQGRAYRVRLGDEAKKTYQDIFGADQLIREEDAESERCMRVGGDAEPGAPSNAPTA